MTSGKDWRFQNPDVKRRSRSSIRINGEWRKHGHGREAIDGSGADQAYDCWTLVGRTASASALRSPIHAYTAGDRLRVRQSERVHAYACDRLRPFRARPNGLAYVPLGCEVVSQSFVGGEYLVLAGLDVGREDRPFSDRIDLQAIEAAHSIRRLLLGTEPICPLRCESLAFVLGERVLNYFGDKPSVPRSGQWMTANRLTKIEEMVEAALGQDLTVQSLANELGLSSGFFSRAFKAATGRSPHAYIIDRRIARARTLISSGIEDLSAVAFASGFSSHAHLTSAFRQRLGVTPRALRQNIGDSGTDSHSSASAARSIDVKRLFIDPAR